MPSSRIRDDATGASRYNTCANRAVCDEARRKQLVRHLQQAQKMLPTATVAAGLAHDFKNILTTIRLHSDLASVSAPAGAPYQQNIAYIREAVDQANHLLERLAGFARARVRRSSLLHVEKEISSMSAMLQAAVGRDVLIEMELSTCEAVRIDRVELQQIIWNCVLNAKEAMRGAGEIVITVKAAEVDHARASRFEPVLPPGRYVEIAIRDTARGIGADAIARASEPFHTSNGAGWGLGLTVVHGCVVRARGGLRIAARQGGGTEVRVVLPAAASPRTRVRKA